MREDGDDDGWLALFEGWRLARRKGWGESLPKVCGVNDVDNAILSVRMCQQLTRGGAVVVVRDEAVVCQKDAVVVGEVLAAPNFPCQPSVG